MTATHVPTLLNYQGPVYNCYFKPNQPGEINAFLNEHGFAVVRDMIDAPTAQAYREEAMRVLGKGPDAGWHSEWQYAEKAPVFCHILENEHFMALNREMLGCDDLTLSRGSALIREPGSPARVWHTDHSIHRHNPKNRDDLLLGFDWLRGCIFYVDGCEPKRGGLVVVPNSHRPDWPGPEGFRLDRPRHILYKEGETKPYNSMDLPGAFPIHANPTDMVLFHARTWHTNHPHMGQPGDSRVFVRMGLRPAHEPFPSPWEQSPAVRHFIETAPDYLKPYVKDYRGVPEQYLL